MTNTVGEVMRLYWESQGKLSRRRSYTIHAAEFAYLETVSLLMCLSLAFPIPYLLKLLPAVHASYLNLQRHYNVG